MFVVPPDASSDDSLLCQAVATVPLLTSRAGCGLSKRSIRVAQLKCGPVSFVTDAVDWTLYKSCRGDGPLVDPTSKNGDDCSDVSIGGAGASACGPNDTCEQDAIHVYHESIVPGFVYHIELIDDSCDPDNDADYSAPLILPVQIYGDVVGQGLATNWEPADGDAELKDILALIDAIRNRDRAPIKARADLAGTINAIDGKANVADLLVVIRGIRNLKYSFDPPAPCGGL